MKPSNLALLVLTFAFLLGMLFSNHLLKAAHASIDLHDPLRNYLSVDAEDYAVLKISGSNGYTILIEEGEKHSIKVMRRRISFFKNGLKGDTLHITFSGANIPLEQASQAGTPVGIIIQSPALSQLVLKDTYNRLKGLQGNKLSIQLEGRATAAFVNCRLPRLSIAAKDKSNFNFIETNTIDTLSLSLANTAYGTLRNLHFSILNPHLSDSASLVLSNKALEKIMKAVNN